VHIVASQAANDRKGNTLSQDNWARPLCSANVLLLGWC
jgi:hypothetical protein